MAPVNLVMPPLFSVLLACRRHEVGLLLHTLAYLRAQTHPGWQLVVVGEEMTVAAAVDACQGALIRPSSAVCPDELARADALGAALSVADGSWVAILDPGDELGDDAFLRVAEAVRDDPGADVVYSDEDEQDGDGTGPFRKPNWSPEYLEGLDYFGRLTAYRRSVVDRAGGFRPDLDGAHEWDLALRVTELTEHIVHVARPMCRRRVPLRDRWRDERVRDASRRAALDRYSRRGRQARVEVLDTPGCLLVRPRLDAEPPVTVVIPTAGSRRPVRGADVVLVENCLRGLAARTDYQRFDVVLVVGETEPPGLRRRAEELLGPGRVRLVAVPGPFDFSLACNTGALFARGEYLLLLNDDTEPIEPQWLRLLVERAQDPAVGAVGAKLLFEDGRVQHAGVFQNRDNVPNHIHFHAPDGAGYHGSLHVTLNHTAVTGACLLIRRAAFLDVGGLTDELPLGFGDVDLCLKLREQGLRNVLVNAARLHHYESSSRDATVREGEYATFRALWPGDSARECYVSHHRLPG